MIRTMILVLAAALAAPAAYAQDFAGQFTDSAGSGATLTLQSTEDGIYAGALTMDGESVPLIAEADGGVLAGEMSDGFMTLAFRARLEDATLVMDLVSPDFPEEVMDTLEFVRADPEAKASSADEAAADVVVNGNVLDAEQLAQLEATYGVRPLSGDYWYDAFSGLYGVVGYQAYGFMFPGHEFGTLDRNVSRGNTSVFVNGRELPQEEWLIWSYMLGYPIQMGNYWLDAQGNAGYVGNPIPTVNLFAASMQNSYGGQGGGGDNFWSSRFSAGNSNADNTQGYVSVPGHGPVGYGF
ncbi:MAG: hypothetical protein KJO56_00810 [Gammaproteobacteria bacterium]|nr:hypothetical protein [Gammaproteobacteria bacterium]